MGCEWNNNSPPHFAHTTFCLRYRSANHTGILACLDGYMNIAMEQCEEYEGGQLKSKFGDVFIRGNNVMYIATEKKMK